MINNKRACLLLLLATTSMACQTMATTMPPPQLTTSLGSMFGRASTQKKYASFMPRLGTDFLDLCTVETTSYYFVLLAHNLGFVHTFRKQIIIFFIIGIMLETISIMNHGINKRAACIKVVDENGKNPTVMQALIRGCLKYLLILVALLFPTQYQNEYYYRIVTLLSILPSLTMFFNQEQRALYDMVAKTYVVKM